MSIIVFVVVGCIVSLVLITLAICTGYLLYGQYVDQRNIGSPIQHIPCDDVKATAITLSQNENNNIDDVKIPQSQQSYHFRKRSQSDPDILLDSVVAVAIESPDQNTPQSIKSELTTESTESLHTDDDFDESVSPLSTPTTSQSNNTKAYANTLSEHHRTKAIIPEITEAMIQRAITILDETTPGTTTATKTATGTEVDAAHSASPSTSSIKLFSNTINQVIKTMDNIEEEDDEDEDEYEYKNEPERKEEERQDTDSRIAITRMIVGDPDVRVEYDESQSSVSAQSTNFSCSTDESQYTGFMKKGPSKEMKIQEVEEEENDCNSDENENGSTIPASSFTVTYDNTNDIDYNVMHGVKAVGVRNSPYNQNNGIAEDKEIVVRREPVISRRLSKLSEKSESRDDTEGLIGISDADIASSSENEMTVTIERKGKIRQLKQKISEYKQTIKSKEGTSSKKKQRRQSVTALKKNRVVKSRRPLFENEK